MKGLFTAEALSVRPQESFLPKCSSCRLYERCASPKIPVQGLGKRKILIVLESPGKAGDSKTAHAADLVERQLEDVFARNGFNLQRDAWITSAVICNPTNATRRSRAATDQELDWCRPNLAKTLRDLNPEIIIPLGGSAVQSLLTPYWTDRQGFQMARWHGWQIPLQALNAWICPTWDVGTVYEERSQVMERLWQCQMKAALAKEGRPWNPVPDWDKRIDILMDQNEAAERIMLMTESGRPLAWDIETEGLKPDNEALALYTCSLSDGRRSISFPWHGKAIEAMCEFFRHPVLKWGFNTKYESRWIRSRYGIRVKNWQWCGMIAAHVLDCRPGIPSLHFQSLVRLGRGKAGDRISSYLQADGSNARNRIRDADLVEVLRYGGMDSLLEWYVCEHQMREMGYDLEF